LETTNEPKNILNPTGVKKRLEDYEQNVAVLHSDEDKEQDEGL
jgi:hypothetical protein